MKKQEMQRLYNINKKLFVGDLCFCPACNTAFIKESYQQVFCKSTSNKTKCKDRYWNTVDENRRNNTTRNSSPSNSSPDTYWEIFGF